MQYRSFAKYFNQAWAKLAPNMKFAPALQPFLFNILT